MANTMPATREEFEKRRETILAEHEPSRPRIRVCGGTSCRALASGEVAAAFEKSLQEQGIDAGVELKVTGCPGFCEQGPLVVIHPERILYTRVRPTDVPEIVAETISKGQVVERLLYADPVTGQKIVHDSDLPFYKAQHRILLKDSGLIDPRQIEDYLAAGGYRALTKALFEMTAEEVLEEIKQSGLRGRGGAGFPTGVKWEVCRNAAADTRYIICNAEEGDPGNFQDRALIEGNPHSILEGMIIGAYAMGARQAFIYIRNEYPLAAELMRLAIQQAKVYGLLGEDILGSGFGVDVEIHLDAGAFVCGEETALMASIEGRVGEPRPKPPFPAQSGLWGKPTNINNVKTWALVRHIIDKGSKGFAQIGSEKSKGTALFSVAGKIKNTGLVEIPMGTSVRHLIESIGGANGKTLKAVQLGGASGGCLPESLWDLPIDYESLTDAGSLTLSGGMIVMDESNCMVDMARYFLGFTKLESCGKCTACREGLQRIHQLLDNVTRGLGREGDIELLEELGQSVKRGSMCGLGQAAPNPLLTSIRYFRDEYEAHIRDKSCPAGVCKDLVTYAILPEKCTGCGLCLDACPDGAISGEKEQPHLIAEDRCSRCGICREVCNDDAVRVR
jgi:NADH:ubiquinone oxidoreductase subunit F (NADH-binding)/(2Fe-2S) ferredoxin